MQDQPVVRIPAKRPRDNLFELGLDLFGGFAGGKAGAVAYSKDVRVDGECLFAKSGVEDDVRGLPAHAR
jgi:hypothetical protein